MSWSSALNRERRRQRLNAQNRALHDEFCELNPGCACFCQRRREMQQVRAAGPVYRHLELSGSEWVEREGEGQ